MCSKDTFYVPKDPDNVCQGCSQCQTKNPECSGCMDPNPQVLCEPSFRRCRKDAPCEPMTRPCSPCQPCCKPTPAPNPCPPYGPKCPKSPCGSCVDIERHDLWSKKWT